MGPIGAEGETLLQVRDVAVRFGGLLALDRVSFGVEREEIRAVIGPNGSGKTTLFNAISGFVPLQSGEIRFGGRVVSGAPRHVRAGCGIGRTFQNLALFPTMTVRENVLVGGHHLGRAGFVACGLGLPGARREEREGEGRLRRVMAELELEAVAGSVVSSLPFATQKRVELARALAGAPTLLLLDEPAGGLNHQEVEAFGGLIRSIRSAFGLSILLVEHHMGLVMAVADRALALEFGRVIADGAPGEVSRDPEVIRAYLGEAEPA